MRIVLNGFFCLLFAVLAVGQSKSPSPSLTPRPNSPDSDMADPAENSNVPADAPVITVQGLCEKPVESGAASADCKTVITRADFQRIVNSVQPTMTLPQQKQFAGRYVTVLMLAQKAHELGLDRGPNFDEQVYISRLQILARLAGERLQKEATNVSDAEIEGYYRQHIADYKTITYDRLYVPRQKQITPTPTPPAKKAGATTPGTPNKIEAAKSETGEAAMKAEADKLRARAAAGEDFTKLQQEAYDFAGNKQKATSPRSENVRKASIPPTDASIFDLKNGEVSPVFNDPAGYMIYKVVEIKELPVTALHDEITRALQAEKIKASIEALQNSAKTTLNDAYFATPAPPTLRNPGEAPAAQPPTSGNPPPGKQ